MADYTQDFSFSTLNNKVISGISPPVKNYYISMSFLALLIGWGIFSWIYQVKTGMGVAGINHPVGWGVYITNFVFWVGIAHSGTLISAILFLVRSKWRDAVSRSTEAMTVFAVMTAGLFPLIHLGRVWVFYFILPYPNQRALYPNFMSPLVLDLLAVITYLTVSIIFFYFGLIPDTAAVRDRFEEKLGSWHWKTRFHKFMSMNWSGTLSQWRHYNRAYLYFAMFATPLVISVHSIVSWDFAASLLPGWHSTLFAPYFVAGAIHSGLAMALTLMIPMRKFLKMQGLITDKHLQVIAKLMILTTLILAYSYIVEPFIEFYTGSEFHIQFAQWRMTGYMAWIYYMILVCNVAVPLTFLFRKPRINIRWLFIASLLVNVGMWFERFMIVTGSTAHDFMPHNWGKYVPTWVEVSITVGTAAFFLFNFMLFAKLLPVIPLADFKDYLLRDKLETPEPCKVKRKHPPKLKGVNNKLYTFSSANNLIGAVKSLCDKGFSEIETFSPVKIAEVEEILGVRKSPVQYWTVGGAIAGLLSGLWLTVGSVNIYDLIVGGKPPVQLVPFVLVMFEFTILLGSITNLVAATIYTGLYKRKLHPYYRKEFSSGTFGLLVSFDNFKEEDIDRIIQPITDSENHDQQEKP